VLAEILKRAHRNPFRALMKAGPAPNWKAILNIMPAEDMLEEPSLALFQRQWKAGFSQVRQLFVAPSNLFRMYCFRA
jgi:hypothetical protein